MTREQAKREAQAIATADGLRMVVAYDPYSEEPDLAERFGFYPRATAGIFSHEKVVDEVEP